MSGSQQDCVLCGTVERNIFSFEFPDDPKLRSRWLQFCSLNPEQDMPDKIKLCCYHFRNKDLYLNDGILKLRTDSVPVFRDKESSIFRKSARVKRNVEPNSQVIRSKFSSKVDVNEDNTVILNDGCTVDENSYVPIGDSFSIYEAVQQDLLSTFENKIITISDPEKVCSVGNVQVISFVSEDELSPDDELAPKYRKCVRVVKQSQTFSPVDTVGTNSEHLIPRDTGEPETASSEPSDRSSYLCSVEAIRKNRDLDHPFGIAVKRKSLIQHPRYAGDIKTDRFTSADSGRKAVTVLKNIALHLKTKLKRTQRRNAQLHNKVSTLQDKLIRLTEESIW